MKIAVTYDNGNVFAHFGHCEQFKIYNVENNNIVNSEIISAIGSGHGALADFLKNNMVDVLICGGIGAGAKTALSQQNIKFYPGVCGNADEKVNDFINGKLRYDLNITCSHHSGCGEHNCGENKNGCGGNH